MTPRILVILASGALLLGACASGGPQVPQTADCIGLFRYYDQMQQWVARPDNRTIPPGLAFIQAQLRQSNCITMNADLAGMEALPVVQVTDSGAVIVPTSMHAGVVTSDADDARVRAFFEARGVRARSVGEAGLGRRIYIGPFRTDGAIRDARALAISAGFAHPYAASF